MLVSTARQAALLSEAPSKFPKSPSVRARLWQLALGALLPLVVLIVGLAVTGYDSDRAHVVEQAKTVAHGIALAVEVEIQDRAAAMEVLAQSPSLMAGDLETFYSFAKSVAERQAIGTRIQVLRPDGQQVMNTQVAFGTPLPARASLESLKRVIATGQPSLTDMHLGAFGREQVITIDVPVTLADGSIGLVLALDPPRRLFEETIRRQNPPTGWVVSVFDRNGVNVARTPNGDQYVGKKASATLLPDLLAHDHGATETTSLEGTALLTAWSRPGPTGWSVAVGVPQSVVYAPLWRTLAVTLGVCGATLVAALMLATHIAARITAPIRRLTELGTAEHVIDGNVTSLGLREADSAADVLVAAVHKRTEAERGLRLSEERMRSLATATSDVIYRMSPDWREMRQLDGPGFLANAAEPGGSWLNDYIFSEDQPQIMAAIEEAIRTKSVFDLEHWARVADGSRGWTHSRAVPLLNGDGEIREWIGAASDMTPRKRAEEALRDSEAQLAAELEGAQRLQEVSAELLHEQRPERLYDRIVEAAARLMRADAASMQEYVAARSGLRLIACRGFHPQSAGFWEWVGLKSDSACGKALVYGTREIVSDVETCEYISGTAHLAEYRRSGIRAVQSTPLISRTGRSLGMISTHWRQPHAPSAADLRLFDVLARQAADLIERMQAQEALRDSESRLRELNATLEERVREEVSAREDAQSRAAQAQRMQALGQLAGGIAHDINNVLQAVQGGSEMLARRCDDAGEVRRLANMIGASAERGAGVTSRLLAFSRRADLQTEQIDAAALVVGMKDILAHSLGSGIAVRVEVPKGLSPLVTDKAQLETILVNLATNGRDAMDGMGVLTLAVAEEAQPDKSFPGNPMVLDPGRYIHFSVADTGRGMDAAMLARVTEPFFTTKPQGKGTGLGLAMARGFCEQHGGGIHIESTPGRGTTVHLYFPTAAQSASAPGEKPSGGEDLTVNGNARLLLVDDDAIVLSVLAAELQYAGLTVAAFSSGQEALAHLDGGAAVDVLVSDLSMPVMDGLKLIREAQRRRPNLPGILLTGFSLNAAEIARDGEFEGPFVLLRKPISGSAIVERIAELLKAPCSLSETEL
jgi:signal transduction histidine kinase/PAS domain-containing protein